MQRALVHLAANLPNTSGAVNFAASVAGQLQQLRMSPPNPVPVGIDTSHVSAAADFIKQQLGNFFRGL
jgi:hypothetical protein